ncbi:MAG: oxygen-independent coproporphyrinogen III oxidase [Pseudomonadota bacterium]
MRPRVIDLHSAPKVPLFDSELIKKYSGNGPRYTSYPTAAQFDSHYTSDDYIIAAQRSNELIIPSDLSLYVHIPFCDTICYYCACNKIVTKNRARAEKYLDYLIRELHMHAELYDGDRRVVQLHFGGGTPTFLSDVQFKRIMREIDSAFTLTCGSDRDFSIEIDPRSVTPSRIGQLADLGFNRFSLGVQDIDLNVQRAINRIQPLVQTHAIVDACRKSNASSINIDLIYGLPRQTETTFSQTLQMVTHELRPDRLSVFNYAHMPERFKTQRQIDELDLPGPDQKLRILEQVITTLTDAGYIHIGMDHFALPKDALCSALNDHTLHRNFQGYTTHSKCDLIGLGVSAIGKVGSDFYQNEKRLDDYYSALDRTSDHNSAFAIERGLKMSDEDLVRAEIIQELSCYFSFSPIDVESRFGINFKQSFAWEVDQLEKLSKDGLVEHEHGEWRVTAKGRLLIRNICAVFDEYQQPATSSGFSRLI